MDNIRGQFLLMPVEAADAAFVDCPGAALLLSRLYNSRCYRSGKVVLDIGGEARSMGRHRNSIGNWWRELRRINRLLGMSFFDDYEVDDEGVGRKNIEAHGKEGIAIWLKAAGQGAAAQNPVQVQGAQNIVQPPNAQNIVQEGGVRETDTQEFVQHATANQPAAQADAQHRAQNIVQNQARIQEISNSGINNNSLASKQASPPARESESENVTAIPIQQASGHTQPQASEQSPPPASQHTHQRAEQPTQPPAAPPDDLERRTLELTGYARLPQHWVRQLEEWRLARYPDRAVARVFEWAWEVKASEGRVPGRGAMTKTLRAIAQEKEEEQHEHERTRVRPQPKGRVQPEPETLAELKRRVRAERAGFA